MATSVNKSISGVQTRFSRRSQQSLVPDVSRIVTRKGSAKSHVNDQPIDAAPSSMKKTANIGRVYRCRRAAEHADTAMDSKEETLPEKDIEESLGNRDTQNGGHSLTVGEDAGQELHELKDKDAKNGVDSRSGDVRKDSPEMNGVEDLDSGKDRSKNGKNLRSIVHRLAPTPGFVDKNSLPSDLLSPRRVRRLASLNAAAKVNVFFEPSSPLAGRSLTDIMQHSKKVQGGEGEYAEQATDERPYESNKGRGRSRLTSGQKSDSSYLESPDLLSEAARTSTECSSGLKEDNIGNDAGLKRQLGDSEEEIQAKRTKIDEHAHFTVTANHRFEKGREVVDVGLQVALPRNDIPDRLSNSNKAVCCTCRSPKVIDIPIKSYVSTYANGTLVSFPITKTHRLTPQPPEKPSPDLAQGDLACRSKRVAGLNSRAMLNAILCQERKLPSSQSVSKTPKVHPKRSYYEHGLSNTVPSALKIPKINFAATSTSNFSSFGKTKTFGGHSGKTTNTGSYWQSRSGVASHDGPKRTNGWIYLGSPMVKPYYYNDFKVRRKYYSGIKRNDEVIYVRDSVLLKSGPRRKDLPFVARVSGFWEEDEGPNAGEMMMSVLWYYRPEQTEMGKQPDIHGENEILASRHKDDNSVACIVDKCYVLSYPEYCRYRAAVKRAQDCRRTLSANLVPLREPRRSDEKTPLTANPKLVFFCRQIYDYRMGRIMKNPVIYSTT